MAGIKKPLLFCMAAMAALCFALRFYSFGDTLFVYDEPLFQLLIDKHLAAGTIPFTSFRGSSIPLAYGAGGLWIYRFFRLFAFSPEATAFLHTLSYTLGNLALVYLLKKRFSDWILVSVLLFSSPFLFLFSRHTWDNTFLLPLSAILLIALDGMETSKHLVARFFIAGFVGAYMLNIHLMAGPVVLAAGIACFPILRKNERPFVLLLAGLVPFVALMAPYLYEAIHLYFTEAVAEKAKDRTYWGDSRNVWWLIQRLFIFFSHWGFKPQFNVVYQDFLHFSGPLGVFFKVDIFGWIPKIVAISAVVVLPYQAWKTKTWPNLTERFLLLTIILLLFTFNLLNIPTEPHYFHSVWWVPFLCLALALKKIPRLSSTPFFIFVFAAVFINAAFVVQLTRYVRENGGMRNLTYGLAVGEQKKLVEEVCQMAKDSRKESFSLLVANVTMTWPSTEYFLKKTPNCTGLRVVQASTPQEADWTLVYSNPAALDARLRWEKLR